TFPLSGLSIASKSPIRALDTFRMSEARSQLMKLGRVSIRISHRGGKIFDEAEEGTRRRNVSRAGDFVDVILPSKTWADQCGSAIRARGRSNRSLRPRAAQPNPSLGLSKVFQKCWDGVLSHSPP